MGEWVSSEQQQLVMLDIPYWKAPVNIQKMLIFFSFVQLLSECFYKFCTLQFSTSGACCMVAITVIITVCLCHTNNILHLDSICNEMQVSSTFFLACIATIAIFQLGTYCALGTLVQHTVKFVYSNLQAISFLARLSPHSLSPYLTLLERPNLQCSGLVEMVRIAGRRSTHLSSTAAACTAIENILHRWYQATQHEDLSDRKSALGILKDRNVTYIWILNEFWFFLQTLKDIFSFSMVLAAMIKEA